MRLLLVSVFAATALPGDPATVLPLVQVAVALFLSAVLFLVVMYETDDVSARIEEAGLLLVAGLVSLAGSTFNDESLAHFAGPPTPTGGYERGIFLDGKYIPASSQGTNNHLCFSPDSKHLFWIHAYGNQPYRVFVDGKPLVEFYSAGNLLTVPPFTRYPAGLLQPQLAAEL